MIAQFGAVERHVELSSGYCVGILSMEPGMGAVLMDDEKAVAGKLPYEPEFLTVGCEHRHTFWNICYEYRHDCLLTRYHIVRHAGPLEINPIASPVTAT
jgi:hypothetical protein